MELATSPAVGQRPARQDATHLFISGRPGAGKSALLVETIRNALNAGMTGEEPEVQSLDEMFSEEYIQEQLTQAEDILGFNLLTDFFGEFQGEVAFALTFPNLMAMGSSIFPRRHLDWHLWSHTRPQTDGKGLV